MHVPLWKFVFSDFLDCLVTVPVWMTLGTLASLWVRMAAPDRGARGRWLRRGFLLFFPFLKLRERKARSV